jgi:pyruvate,orthophosphate dikinase
MQRGDFEALRGDGRLPVTIRLLDPPLHEFLPHTEEIAQESARARERDDDRDERALRRASRAARVQPDARHRGCRLGIAYPEIYEMQARAIFEAAARRAERTGKKVAPRDHDPAGRLRRRSSRSCGAVDASPRR